VIRLFILAYEDVHPFQRCVVTKLKRVIDTKKFMTTIIWNPGAFHIVDLFQDGAKFKPTYLLDNIVTPHSSKMYISIGKRKQKESYQFTSTTVPFTDQKGL
jgi:hypothetical protein